MRDPIDVGGRDFKAAIEPDVTIAEIVRHDHDNIGSLCRDRIGTRTDDCLGRYIRLVRRAGLRRRTAAQGKDGSTPYCSHC